MTLDAPTQLAATDRFVVTGAGGWLGRSTLEVLRQWIRGGDFDSRVLAYASRARPIALSDGTIVNVQPLSSAQALPGPGRTWLVHLAFLTRDHVQGMSPQTFVSTNIELISAGLQLARTTAVSGAVLVSSGAARGAHDGPADDVRRNPYGFLKNVEQGMFTQFAAESGASLVTARLWGASGPDVVEPSKYALGDFVMQGLTTGTIEVRADHEVWRRYVSSRQLMELCLKLMLRGEAIEFDSGGPLIEIAELARMVASALPAGIEVVLPTRDGPPDRAFSDGANMQALMESAGMLVESIDQQVADTVAGLRTRFGNGGTGNS